MGFNSNKKSTTPLAGSTLEILLELSQTLNTLLLQTLKMNNAEFLEWANTCHEQSKPPFIKFVLRYHALNRYCRICQNIQEKYNNIIALQTFIQGYNKSLMQHGISPSPSVLRGEDMKNLKIVANTLQEMPMKLRSVQTELETASQLFCQKIEAIQTQIANECRERSIPTTDEDIIKGIRSMLNHTKKNHKMHITHDASTQQATLHDSVLQAIPVPVTGILGDKVDLEPMKRFSSDLSQQTMQAAQQLEKTTHSLEEKGMRTLHAQLNALTLIENKVALESMQRGAQWSQIESNANSTSLDNNLKPSAMIESL